MSRPPLPSRFAARPSADSGRAEAWVRSPNARAAEPPAYTARLTIDVTPVLRGRIKITAFERGLTVADMLRALLDREFGAHHDLPGGRP